MAPAPRQPETGNTFQSVSPELLQPDTQHCASLGWIDVQHDVAEPILKAVAVLKVLRQTLWAFREKDAWLGA